MHGAGFAITKGARRATRIGGRLRAVEKAAANRANRRQLKQELHLRGVDAEQLPRLWTEWEVI